ncbi:MAG: ABC transporter ATP-binding protein [Acidimicrobiia bacterium]|nr:ABC transporter ATP-binding protein [Acidimicrobiia bacterium]
MADRGAGDPGVGETTADWVFRADAVTKSYDGETNATDGLTIEVSPGEVYGLLGPNGAGKSTLVKQVIGLLKSDSGRITLGSFDLVDDPDAARQLCSYLPQAQMPIDSFKPREAIDIAGLIRGGPGPAVKRRREEMIEALEIGEWRDTLGARLSGGIKRLVGFAMVTVWPGQVIILDEPTNDVDPLRRRRLWEQVRRLGSEGAVVLLVAHNVMEAEKSVDRLAIISEGKLIAEGTPSSLKADDRGRLRLQLMLHPGNSTPELAPLVLNHVRIGNNLVTVIDEDAAAAGIAWAQDLLARGAIEEYALGATTLEDVYIRLTGHKSEPEK